MLTHIKNRDLTVSVEDLYEKVFVYMDSVVMLAVLTVCGDEVCAPCVW